MAHPSLTYTKPALSSSALLAHLKGRGLLVSDMNAAIHTLEYIGYYRLLIYMRPLQDSHKNFLPGTKFEDVLNLYNFDRELRLLCLDAIERVEVALRSAIVSQVAVPHGAHFFLDTIHFEELDGFVGFFNTASNAKYLAIKHYKSLYISPKLAPIWAITEAITYGALSRLYSGLKLQHRKAIALKFKLDETVLVSWFRSLNVLRNMCAHHNRLWNFHMLVDRPIAAAKFISELAQTDRFYARAVVLKVLLEVIDPTSNWKQRLVTLISRYPSVPISDMGFPSNWQTRAFWT